MSVVFGVDPGFDFGRVDVLHPAIGVADLGAEVVVGLVGFASDGIGEGGVGGGWSHEVRFPDFLLLEDLAAVLAARSFLRSAMRRFCWVGGMARTARAFGGVCRR